MSFFLRSFSLFSILFSNPNFLLPSCHRPYIPQLHFMNKLMSQKSDGLLKSISQPRHSFSLPCLLNYPVSFFSSREIRICTSYKINFTAEREREKKIAQFLLHFKYTLISFFIIAEYFFVVIVACFA